MWFWSRYDVFESDSNESLPEGFLDLFENELMSSNRVLVLLTGLGVKLGCDVEGFFNSQESFESFVSVVNMAGLNCIVQYNPSSTNAESLRNIMDEDSFDLLTDEFEVKARIYLTKENYKPFYFWKMNFFKKIYKPKYHRMYGKFLGFKEEDIEAFIHDQKNDLTFERDSKKALGVRQMIEKYGGDFSDEKLKVFEALNFGLLKDSKKRFERAVEQSMERKEKLENSPFDSEEVINKRTFNN